MCVCVCVCVRAMCRLAAALKIMPKSRKDLSFHFSPDAIRLKLLPPDAPDADTDPDNDAGEVALRDVNVRSRARMSRCGGWPLARRACWQWGVRAFTVPRGI